MQNSTSTNTILSYLHNKSVLVFDTETTGLPDRVPGANWGNGEYWLYTNNDKYKKSRIVSIAWAMVSSFNRNTIDTTQIHNYIRYPENFDTIPTEHIHGISISMAREKGVPFRTILFKCGLAKAILNSDYILAHNIAFDIHILLNELYRCSIGCNASGDDCDDCGDGGDDIADIQEEKQIINKCIEHILQLQALQKCICSGEISTNICKIPFKNNKFNGKNDKKYKMPKLCELYQYLYNEEYDKFHSADGDVLALLRCLKKL